MEKPTGDEKRQRVTDNRPVADPRLSIRPVDVVAFERRPRYVPVDIESRLGRPTEGEKSHPSMADGPTTMIGPKEGMVVQDTVTLPYQTPPPCDAPEGANGEVMPLIIIEHKSEGETPKMTDGRVPASLDILVPQSLEMTNSEDQGVLSAPMSPNRVRKGHSQDMPAEGSIFDVSPELPGYQMRPAGGGIQPADITQAPPPNYVGFNNPFF